MCHKHATVLRAFAGTYRYYLHKNYTLCLKIYTAHNYGAAVDVLLLLLDDVLDDVPDVEDVAPHT